MHQWWSDYLDQLRSGEPVSPMKVHPRRLTGIARSTPGPVNYAGPSTRTSVHYFGVTELSDRSQRSGCRQHARVSSRDQHVIVGAQRRESPADFARCVSRKGYLGAWPPGRGPHSANLRRELRQMF